MFASAKNMINAFSSTFVDRTNPEAEQPTSTDCSEEIGKPQEPGTDLQDTISQKLNVAKQWSTYLVKKIIENGEVTSKKIAEKMQVATKMDKILPEVIQKVPYWREFNEIQEAFTAEQSQTTSAQIAERTAFLTGDISLSDELLPPWHPDVSGLSSPAAVESLKTSILALSSHEKTFLVPAPKAAQLTDHSEASDSASQTCVSKPTGALRSPAALQLACSLLQADSKLASMRYCLVPSRISEAEFWHNYLYRVSVLQESAQLSAMAGDSPASGDSSDYVCVDADSPPAHSLAPSDQPPPAAKEKRSAGTGSARTKAKATKPRDKPSKDEPPVATVAKSGSPAVRANASGKVDSQLTADEQLEAELAREVDELLSQKDRNEPEKLTASPGTSADDELDAELELELSELSKADSQGK